MIETGDGRPIEEVGKEPEVNRLPTQYLINESEVKTWKIWAQASHSISSQRLILNSCVLLLFLTTISWVVAFFVWGWGPESRVTEEFLKWWFGAIGAGYIGTTFGSVIALVFQSKAKK